ARIEPIPLTSVASLMIALDVPRRAHVCRSRTILRSPVSTRCGPPAAMTARMRSVTCLEGKSGIWGTLAILSLVGIGRSIWFAFIYIGPNQAPQDDESAIKSSFRGVTQVAQRISAYSSFNGANRALVALRPHLTVYVASRDRSSETGGV